MTKGLVTVVIPTYNRRQFIGETVDSVLAQTYRDLEVIVVDDGSTDGTEDLLKERYGNEPRFRYIWQENAERAVARNTGIKAARGEFVAFLDSDDLWLPAKLELQIQYFARDSQLVMVHTGFSSLYENGTTVSLILENKIYRQRNIFGQMVFENFVSSPTPLVRRWVLDSIGGFNEDRQLICFEDWELWIRIASLGPVGYVPESMAIRRLHDGNTEKTLTPMLYCHFMRTILQTLDQSQRAVAASFAGRRFWREIRLTIQKHDINTACAYFRSGLACLGSRFLLAL